MDIKSAFLNGSINEEVYLSQPLGFENDEYSDHVLKLKCALYGLKQALRAWYERLSTFLVDHGYSRVKVDTTLFIKHQGKHTFLVQVYVDDIIFGSTNMHLVKEFSKVMQGEFEMSLMRELNYFLGLQIKQLDEGTIVCQTKYCRELLKRNGMEDSKSINTPMPTNGNLKKDEHGKSVNVKKYRCMI